MTSTTSSNSSGTKNPFDTKLNIPSPSHILNDGRYVYLPPVSAAEKASFFARNVARYQLIQIGNDRKTSTSAHEDDESGEGEEDAGNPTNENPTNPNDANHESNTTKDSTTETVHPLVMASARIQTNGISELSKAINLASLVSTGEYMGLFAVVDDDTNENSNTGDGSGTSGGTGTSGAGANASTTNPTNSKTTTDESSSTATNSNTQDTDDAIMEENTLRANYTLHRKQNQFAQATELLRSHAKQCCVATTVQKVLDQRLLELRKHWSLAAPEHGRVRLGPVRPNESVVLDVEIYHRDRGSGIKNGASTATTAASAAAMHEDGLRSRIVRSVPRYATIEINDSYDVHQDISQRRKHCEVTSESPISTHPSPSKKRKKTSYTSALLGSSTSTADKSISDHLSDVKDSERKVHTYAQPFAIADRMGMGQSHVEFDPENVPMLTLVYQIEKSSTGFIQSVSLDSQVRHQQKGDKSMTAADEQLLQPLQHSLFCAKLFDFIQREIASQPKASNQRVSKINGSPTRNTASGRTQTTPIVWLSSEMEESFLPPPSLMSGGQSNVNGTNTMPTSRKSPICVVHYQEGEVKVQLDSEYTLTVKLIDTKHKATKTDSSVEDSNAMNDSEMKLESNTADGNGAIDTNSGSQNAEKIQTLCRTLLLHSQFVYHDYCKKLVTNHDNQSNETPKVGRKAGIIDYGAGALSGGISVSQKPSDRPLPHILESCITLGSKIILEGKIRNVLKSFKSWIKTAFDESLGLRLECLWLPISMFDYHSQVAISVGDFLCMDVSIDGDEIVVTTFDHIMATGSRLTKFVSTLEFEMFLRVTLMSHLRRAGRKV